MKVLGIGNAIVDVLCKVSDDFLNKNSLTKSTMKLVDETEFKKLLRMRNLTVNLNNRILKKTSNKISLNKILSLKLKSRFIEDFKLWSS